MAKFKHNMEEKAAILEVKRALNGKMAIMKDTGKELSVGSPGMTTKIVFSNGTVETSASLFGKVLLGTVDSCLELIDGFEKI